MGVVIGIDIGGTFTDVVGINMDTYKKYTVKVPTTNYDHSVGFLNGIQKIISKMKIAASDITKIVHGTTIGTNALLEKKGARIGILTTEGFEDTLEIGRQKRSDMYNLFLDEETPIFLCPRKRRKGIKERMDPLSGKPEIEIDEEQVLESVRELVEKHNVEAIAVNYLYSFINPKHELITKRIIKNHYPEIFISLSHEIDPNFREYERLCLTAFDAYIKPVINKYMKNIEEKLKKENISAPLYIMLSQGGVTGVKMLGKKSVGTLLSGVAAGVIGGKEAAIQSGEKNIITLDVGGTSADVSLIVDGKSLIATESQILSYPLRIPMVDINTIGAGGGSIAYLDMAENLRVGPESASSIPGPVCYDRGGQEPTVTDASLILGYLNERGLANGSIPLNMHRAKQALDEKIASHLNMSVSETAMGIHKITNSIMADAIRLVSVKKGYDPRKFALVSFGGAGGLHSCAVADELGITKIIVPSSPGVLSAEGLIVSDIESQQSMSFKIYLENLNPTQLKEAIIDLKQRCFEEMSNYNIEINNTSSELVLMMRYVGQSYEIPITVDVNDSNMIDLDEITQLFHKYHKQIYGHSDIENQIELVSIRLTLSHQILDEKVKHKLYSDFDIAKDAKIETRQVYFDEFKKYVPTKVFNSSVFPVGEKIEGPLIVEQMDTTIIVSPSWTIIKDERGTMIMEKAQSDDISKHNTEHVKNKVHI